MFSRTAKSVVKNFGQRNYHAAQRSRKNTRALVLAAERSRVPEIMTELAEQSAEKPVLNPNTKSGPEGLVPVAAKKNSPDEKAKGRDFLDILWKLPARGDPITDINRQPRAFPLSNISQNLGISKQKTKAWRNVTESAERILGEMGPSSHSRSCYSRTDFEACLRELLEHCRNLDINDAGFYGCSRHSLPSVRRKREKIKVKHSRKKTANGHSRESTSAAVKIGVQSRSGEAGFNQGARKRQGRMKDGDDRVRCRKSSSIEYRSPGNCLPKEADLTVSKPRMKKGSKVDRASCGKKTQKRFFQKSNAARGNLIIPANFADRKPNLLHDFDSGKTKLKPKSPIGVSNGFSSSRRTSNTPKNIIIKSRRQGQTVLAKTVKSHHSNYSFHKKHVPKRIRHCSITPALIAGRETSLAKNSSNYLPAVASKSLDDIEDKTLGLDVDSLSTLWSGELQSFKKPSSAFQESSIENCSLELSTAVGRTTKNGREIWEPESKGTSLKTSSCESLVFREAVAHPAMDYSERNCEGEHPNFVQRPRSIISSQNMKQLSIGTSVLATSASLSTMPSCPLNTLYKSLNGTKYGAREVKYPEKKSGHKWNKKFCTGSGNQPKGLLDSGITKKKKKQKKKCLRMKVVQSDQQT